MLYWMAEVFDYTRAGVPCFQRLIGKGYERSFLLFLQGLEAKPEGDIWVHNAEHHGVEVRLILPSEYMAARNHGLRFGDMVARMSEDDANHDYLDELVKKEVVAEVFDTTYDPTVLIEGGEVLLFR